LAGGASTLPGMALTEVLRELGGVASTATLVRLTSRPALARAVEAGDVARVSRGRYVLPQVEETQRLAHALSGVLCRTSAALAWGWAVKSVPDKPHLLVPVKRKVDSELRRRVQLHRRDLAPGEAVDGRTSRELTLEQCLRHEPWTDALCVADSALREGFPAAALRALARDARGPGAPQIRRVAAEATAEAANPFESALRGIALDVSGLSVRPQRTLPHGARPDLVDERLRIVLEADSFAWHGDRVALRRDAQRYNLIVVNGWWVLRFAWEDVMFCPDEVHAVLTALTELRTHGCTCLCHDAGNPTEAATSLRRSA
jgi:very-short-patch-repair endonuclease